MQEVFLENVSLFKDLQVGDKFMFQYELSWLRHKRGGTDWSWKKTDRGEEFLGTYRPPYKIYHEHLEFLGIYEKKDDSKYQLVDLVEDFRKNGNYLKPKCFGATHSGTEIRKVL